MRVQRRGYPGNTSGNRRGSIRKAHLRPHKEYERDVRVSALQRRHYLTIIGQREGNIKTCLRLAEEFVNTRIVHLTSQPRTKRIAQLPSNIVTMCAPGNAIQKQK